MGRKSKKTKGYCSIGKAFIRYLKSDETIDLSSSEFDNIEYIGTGAFLANAKAKKAILPKNVKNIAPIYYNSYADNNYIYGLEKIEFYDKDLNKYVDLHDVCISDNRTKYQENFINNYYESFLFTNLCESITDDYIKKIFEQCDIRCIDSTVSTEYTPWEEYQIVRKIYKYIGQNYNIYKDGPGSSINFKSELLIHHGIVCFQFAWMFNRFCDVAGITCTDVAGGGHRWNNVKIGDKWFNVDCCWTWNHSLRRFLTSDDVAKDDSGDHTKKPEYSHIKCTTQIGDVNQDGYINSIDASLILDAYSSSSSSNQNNNLSSFEMVLCDVDRDGYVNSIDASWVLSYYSYIQTNKTAEVPSIEQYMFDNGYHTYFVY